MGTEMGGAVSASELADLAGVTEAEVDRLVSLGILVARDGAGRFLAADAVQVRPSGKELGCGTPASAGPRSTSGPGAGRSPGFRPSFRSAGMTGGETSAAS